MAIEINKATKTGQVATKALVVLRVLLVLAFAAAGGAKIAGAAPMVQLFDHIGAGQWFRYFTGVCEVAGALLLVGRPTVDVGAGLLGLVMLGAVATHLAVIGGSPLPALVLFALCVCVLWLNRRSSAAALA